MEIEVIAFDADDTLWDNEHYFKQNEDAFCEMIKQYLPAEKALMLLNETAILNIPLYGFGIKSFMLSMIESVLTINDCPDAVSLVGQIISLGKKMLNEPVEPILGVVEVLTDLQANYKLILATKGDLLDQERKLDRSGLRRYFHHVEIMAGKTEANYHKLLAHLDIPPAKFLMVGNSLKSDIIPVLNIGGNAIYIPYHITNVHEQYITEPTENKRFKRVSEASEIIALLNHPICQF